jgi:glycosyltransferase involved in cell wall biosynthesis
VLGHTGSGGGFTTVLEDFPDDRLTIAVLINTEAAGANAVAADIARAAFGVSEAPLQDLPAPARELAADGDVRHAIIALRFTLGRDVFLSTNELSNVGNPLLEAMLAARCIVTLDEGDTGNLIRDGDTGVLLKTGDPVAIAAALAALHGEPERRQRLAEGALALAKREFWSWDQRLDAEVDAVSQLVTAKATAV